MASDESNNAGDDKPKGRWLAFWLVLGNFVVGLMGCAVSWNVTNSRPIMLMPAFLGFVFSQTSLLGLWAGLGTEAWLVRLMGVLVGLFYLGGLFSVGVEAQLIYIAPMIEFAGLACAGPFIIGRFFGLRIAVVSDDRLQQVTAQFSTRQLMLLTLVAACLITLTKLQGPQVSIRFFLEVLFIAIPFGILSLVTAWFVLGTRRAMVRTIALLLFAPLLGFVFNMVFQMILSVPNLDSRYWITATTTAAVVLLVSLHAIRRCGFRIRRHRRGNPAFVAGELHEDDKCGTLES